MSTLGLVVNLVMPMLAAVAMRVIDMLPITLARRLAPHYYAVLAWIGEKTEAYRYAESAEPRASRLEVDAAWLEEKLVQCGLLETGNRVVDVTVADLADNRGLSGVVKRVDVLYKSPTRCPAVLVMKAPRGGTLAARAAAISGGSWREQVLLSSPAALPSAVRDVTPRVVHSHAVPWAGEAVLISEHAGPGAVGMNLVFGNQCWGVPALPAGLPTRAAALRAACEACAEIQAPQWQSQALIGSRWIKGADWHRGRGREAWEAAVELARRSWARVKETKMGAGAGVKWDPRLVAALDGALARASWAGLQRRLGAVPHTLTHGDWHAANMLWRAGRVVVVDWAEVAVWEPLADVGQMMISDVDVETRRHEEEACVRAYWARLGERGVDLARFPWDACWAQYKQAGADRWAWVFAVMAGMPLPAVAVQYFHDQLLAFITDHETVPEIRAVVTMRG